MYVIPMSSKNPTLAHERLKPSLAQARTSNAGLPTTGTLGSARTVADFVSWYARDSRILFSRVESPPTDGLMLISLSLRMISIGCLALPRWLSASIVSPAPIAASPTQTAIRCRRAGSVLGRRSRAAARPTPTDTPVPAWPPSKTSCSLSPRRGKPPTPPTWRSVSNRSQRPVSSLWA